MALSSIFPGLGIIGKAMLRKVYERVDTGVQAVAEPLYEEDQQRRAGGFPTGSSLPQDEISAQYGLEESDGYVWIDVLTEDELRLFLDELSEEGIQIDTELIHYRDDGWIQLPVPSEDYDVAYDISSGTYIEGLEDDVLDPSLFGMMSELI